MQTAVSIVVLLMAIASLAVAEDLCPVTEYPVYALDQLPYECYSGFETCPTALCSCVGMSWDSTSKQCTSSERRSADPCVTVASCLQDYTACVNSAYSDAEVAGVASNCTSFASSFTFVHSQALQSVVNPNDFNTSDLFTSCENFVCKVANMTECYDLNASSYDICVAPFPSSTPIPANVPVKIVTIVVTFTADFDSLVSTDAGRKKIKDTMTDALTRRLQYKTVTKSIKYVASNGAITESRRKNVALAAGTLAVTAQASVPASDSATLNKLTSNVDSLKNDKSTGWYSGLSAACGCVIPPPTVSSIVTDSNAQPPSSPSSSACSSGCIAGVVVGGTAAVTIGVGAVAYVSMKKSAAVAPDPTK